MPYRCHTKCWTNKHWNVGEHISDGAAATFPAGVIAAYFTSVAAFPIVEPQYAKTSGVTIDVVSGGTTYDFHHKLDTQNLSVECFKVTDGTYTREKVGVDSVLPLSGSIARIVVKGYTGKIRVVGVGSRIQEWS